MKKTSKFISFIAWSLSIFGAVFLFLAILVAIENKDRDALFGMLMFAAFFGFPGLVMLFRSKKNEKKWHLILQVKGYISSRNKFLLRDFAHSIQKSEIEATALIYELIELEPQIDLIFHKPSGYFLHRKLLDSTYHEIKECPSCGAGLPKQVLLRGEKIICEYCGGIIQV